MENPFDFEVRKELELERERELKEAIIAEILLMLLDEDNKRHTEQLD